MLGLQQLPLEPSRIQLQMLAAETGGRERPLRERAHHPPSQNLMTVPQLTLVTDL